MKTIYDLNAEQRSEHEKLWGTFNDFPPGWRKLTELEFARSRFFSFSPALTEYRQMLQRLQDDPRVSDHLVPIVAATLYFFHDNTGYAMSSDWQAGKVNYYEFGCVHEWGSPAEELKRRNIQLFRSEHAYYCIKCKHLSVVDSSD
jgi:hypothetical protein